MLPTRRTSRTPGVNPATLGLAQVAPTDPPSW